MLPVGDMDRAVSFYRDVVGLTLEFQSPFWTELRWRDRVARRWAKSARAGSGFTSPTWTPRSPRSRPPSPDNIANV